MEYLMKNLKGRAATLVVGLVFGGFIFAIGNGPTEEDFRLANEANTLAGEKFLAGNTTKANIITTASGLQYEVLVKGEGPSPVATSKVTVHYRGTTLEGEEFDSSYERDTPTTFPLNHVIPGWTEGVQLMNVGAKYRFFIPSDLAYGEQGAGSDIAPNATLIFEIELLSF